MGAPVRACSFLPAATRIITALGLADRLVGVTFECESTLPKVVRSKLEGRDLSAAEIDRIVARHAASGDPLSFLDAELLGSLKPETIFTQDLCAVCQIDSTTAEATIAQLISPPNVVTLNPSRLVDLFTCIRATAHALGADEKGEALVSTLTNRLDAVRDRIGNAPRRRVAFIEWISPLYASGHWIPDQVQAAGASDMLGLAGGRSAQLSLSVLRDYDPEMIVVTACGFDLARVRNEAQALDRLPGWGKLTATKFGQVHPVSAEYFTEPSDRLIDGVELLAKLFHPDCF